MTAAEHALHHRIRAYLARQWSHRMIAGACGVSEDVVAAVADGEQPRVNPNAAPAVPLRAALEAAE